jgi:NADH-quinone oxidoreductase subunit K
MFNSITFIVFYLHFIIFITSTIGGWLNRKNAIILIVALELMLLSCILNFVLGSVILNDITGQMYIFFILSIAAVETSVGLSLMLLYFNNYYFYILSGNRKYKIIKCYTFLQLDVYTKELHIFSRILQSMELILYSYFYIKDG